MKKNNIFILNEIINVLQNHFEYNVTELLTTHCINHDGSIDYDIKFTLEDSDKEEKEQVQCAQDEQTNIVKFGDIPEDFIPTADDCVRYDVIPDEKVDEIKEEPMNDYDPYDIRCGNCKYYEEPERSFSKCTNEKSGNLKKVSRNKSTNICSCFKARY